jgi:IS605 OrfB family transposase
LSARLQQNLSKQAAEVVRSQRKKKEPTKPTVCRYAFNLDERFLGLRFDQNSFDLWIKLKSLGEKIILKLPSKKHRHFNNFLIDGWVLRKGGRLRRTDAGYFLDLYLEKPEAPKKTEGRAVGFDCGYKKLLVDSDGKLHDAGLEPVYEKIARKRQKSKGFYRALAERDNAINRTINQIDLSDVQTVVVEDLKHVKRGSSGKIYKKFNNKLQRWTYPKVLDGLSRRCEEEGVTFIRVNPAFTSQRCSSCGHTDKRSRNGPAFVCTSCGVALDADYNAAVNVLHRGVSSPSAA